MEDPYLIKSFADKIIITKSIKDESTDNPWNHYHDFYEIYYYLGNEMNCFIEDAVYSAKKETVLLIDRFLMHRSIYEKNQSRERILILFHADIIEACLDKNMQENLKAMFKNKAINFQDPIKKALLRETFELLYKLSLLNKSNELDLKLLYSLISLLILLNENILDTQLSNIELDYSAKEKLVFKTISYINDNFSDQLTLEQLSDNLFISKHYLCHIFKETTGTSIIIFINSKRLAYAEWLIKNTQDSILSISNIVGFSNVSYFLRIFKKHYGCTPKEFRKTN